MNESGEIDRRGNSIVCASPIFTWVSQIMAYQIYKTQSIIFKCTQILRRRERCAKRWKRKREKNTRIFTEQKNYKPTILENKTNCTMKKVARNNCGNQRKTTTASTTLGL